MYILYSVIVLTYKIKEIISSILVGLENYLPRNWTIYFFMHRLTRRITLRVIVAAGAAVVKKKKNNNFQYFTANLLKKFCFTFFFLKFSEIIFTFTYFFFF